MSFADGARAATECTFEVLFNQCASSFDQGPANDMIRAIKLDMEYECGNNWESRSAMGKYWLLKLLFYTKEYIEVENSLK